MLGIYSLQMPTPVPLQLNEDAFKIEHVLHDFSQICCSAVMNIPVRLYNNFNVYVNL